jgi:hypothetical protein|tara:strand:- start:2237 stop:2623 length:387 start_codon:yes stop_codon:yes gene_type:complete
MSNQLKTANLDSSVLSYKIIQDTQLGPDAIVDVTQGSGTLYAIHVDATSATAHQYLKLKLTTSEVTPGTTTPDMMIFVAAQQRFTVSLPSGLAYSSLSAFLTSSQADSATTNTENANQRYTIVRFITG